MKVIIIEDETAAAANLLAILTEAFPAMEIAAQLESVTESVEWLEQHGCPELIFMDIHLADGSAFSIFEKTKVTSPVIFTTAFDQYALDAFKVNSIDYILKPIKKTDVHRAVEKLKNLSQAAKTEYSGRIEGMARQQRAAQTILIHCKDRIIPIKTEEIAFCYSSNEKVTVCTLKGDLMPYDKTLENIAAILPENNFFRANRQFIINRESIQDISIWFGSRLSLNLFVTVPEKIIVSKARVPEFKKWISGTAQ